MPTTPSVTVRALAFQTLGFECAYTVAVDPDFPGNGDWDCPVVAFDRMGVVTPAFECRWGHAFGRSSSATQSGPECGSPHVVAIVVDGLAYLVDSRSTKRYWSGAGRDPGSGGK